MSAISRTPRVTLRLRSVGRIGRRQSSGKLVPEGIEGRVPYRGSVAMMVHQLVGGLKSPAWVTAVAPPSRSCRQKTRFVRISGAGLRESHVHDVIITREAPNYRVE